MRLRSGSIQRRSSGSWGWGIDGPREPLVEMVKAYRDRRDLCVGLLEEAGYRKSAEGADADVVVFNTGAAQKYPETVPLNLPHLDKNRPVNYEALAR